MLKESLSFFHKQTAILSNNVSAVWYTISPMTGTLLPYTDHFPILSILSEIDFLGNWRSAVLRRIFCAGRSVSTAALLGVMQGRDTKPGAEETSKTVLRKFPRKSNKCDPYHMILAEPLWRAASMTACATVWPIRLSNANGRIYSSFSSLSSTSEAIALEAAIFISSLISFARQSSAPLKIPGKQSTLLIWFGKSERPVPMILADGKKTRFILW